jgi:hypothetical protein
MILIATELPVRLSTLDSKKTNLVSDFGMDRYGKGRGPLPFVNSSKAPTTYDNINVGKVGPINEVQKTGD